MNSLKNMKSFLVFRFFLCIVLIIIGTILWDHFYVFLYSKGPWAGVPDHGFYSIYVIFSLGIVLYIFPGGVFAFFIAGIGFTVIGFTAKKLSKVGAFSGSIVPLIYCYYRMYSFFDVYMGYENPLTMKAYLLGVTISGIIASGFYFLGTTKYFDKKIVFCMSKFKKI